MNRIENKPVTPRTGLKIDDYVKNIRLQLGGTVLKLECDEQLPEIVEMSFNEIRNYITDIDFLTLPYAPLIDVSEYHIAEIHYLMRGTSSSMGISQLQDAMYLYINQSNWALQSDYVDRVANAMLIQQNKSMLSTDLDFNYDKRNNRLYIYAQQLHPKTITIAYTREYEKVEDIYEPFWQNLLRRLSLAHTKEILGRIRSKFKTSTSTWDLDGETLLAEAQSELSEIRTFLDANNDVLFPLD